MIGKGGRKIKSMSFTELIRFSYDFFSLGTESAIFEVAKMYACWNINRIYRTWKKVTSKRLPSEFLMECFCMWQIFSYLNTLKLDFLVALNEQRRFFVEIFFPSRFHPTRTGSFFFFFFTILWTIYYCMRLHRLAFPPLPHPLLIWNKFFFSVGITYSYI